MKHRNDIYGNTDQQRPGSEAIPAATVVLLRDAPELEVLMLHKTSKVAFGGMWVFPGGRVDRDDYQTDGDPNTAARHAAARETLEEAGIVARPDVFVWFSHWTPPASTPKRFATWFFAAAAEEHTVQVDGGEIQNHEWLRPAAALERHTAGQIDLAPPTWITLHQLSQYADTATALARLDAQPPRFFETRIAERADGVRVAMWQGDSGYDSADAEVPGRRHRLVLARSGFVFENTVG